MLRDYVGIIWIADQPGERFRISARSLDEARDQAEKLYGTGHVISIYNEDDADRPR